MEYKILSCQCSILSMMSSQYISTQKEVGEGICEFHIFDMGSFEEKMPKELKRAYYHKWGLKKQDSLANKPLQWGLNWGLKKQDPSVEMPASGQMLYGLLDTFKLLGHEKLDVIDIFKIDCEFHRHFFPVLHNKTVIHCRVSLGIHDLVNIMER